MSHKSTTDIQTVITKYCSCMIHVYAILDSLINNQTQSPHSSGPSVIRILVGARTVLMETGKSGPIEASRDGAADAEAEAANDGAFFDPFVLPDPFPTGAEMDDPLPNLSSPSLAAVAIATANCDSLSPAHVRANHRPPAIPRTSRCAKRQRRTFLPLLSRGIVGAAPVFILGAG